MTSRSSSEAATHVESGHTKYCAYLLDGKPCSCGWSAVERERPQAEASVKPAPIEYGPGRHALECFYAAEVEGWHEALAEGDIERIRDLWNRRISYARQALEYYA